MTILEELLEKAQTLTPPLQLKALHYVDALSQNGFAEDLEFSRFSLGAALQGMADQEWPEYKDGDYLEKWQ